MKVTIAFLLVSLCIDVCLTTPPQAGPTTPLKNNSSITTTINTSINSTTSSINSTTSSIRSTTSSINSTTSSIRSTTSSINSTTTSSSIISTTSKSSSFNYACMPKFLAFLYVVGLLLL